MRRMRRQAEWKVETHIFSAGGADQVDHAGAHLVGRLVGEGDGEDAPGRRRRRWPAGGRCAGSAPGSCPSRPRRRSAAARPGARPPPAGAGSGRRPARPGCPRTRRPWWPNAGGGAGRRPRPRRSRDRLRGRRPRRRHRLQHRRRPPPTPRPPRRRCRTAARCRAASEPEPFRRRPLRTAPAAPRRHGHSHSIVPGGFDVTSSATRFTPSTSLMMREAMRSTRS